MTIIPAVPGPGIPLPSLPWLLLGALVTYRAIIVVYRLFFHPLAGFPGPKLFASSYLPYLYHDKIKGTWVKEMTKVHEKYGPIVRISPNRVAIDGAIGWQEVFARRAHQPEFEKSPEFYQAKNRIGIFTAEREDHRRQRRLMSHAFSQGALIQQENYVTQYVDLLIKQLHRLAAAGDEVDLTRWFNYLTFDIIGELAFGDPFHSLEKSDYHPWVALIFASIRAASQMTFLAHYPLLRPIIYLLMGEDDLRKRVESETLAREKTEKRIALEGDTRNDFLSYILRFNGDEKGMTHEELLVNARGFIAAGSETTATALIGLVFYLSHNPTVLARLRDEIQTTFTSEADIDMKSTAGLPYLHGCLEEILRIYPPAGETPPRISPGDVVGGKFIPKGTMVSIYQWATHHLASNFTDPDDFVPERWLPAQHQFYNPRYNSDNKAAFRPFSAGPRDCIGKNLAYSEMRIVVARMLWNFDFELVKGQEDWISSQRAFVVYEKGPLFVKLKSRV